MQFTGRPMGVENVRCSLRGAVLVTQHDVTPLGRRLLVKVG